MHAPKTRGGGGRKPQYYFLSNKSSRQKCQMNIDTTCSSAYMVHCSNHEVNKRQRDSKHSFPAKFGKSSEASEDMVEIKLLSQKPSPVAKEEPARGRREPGLPGFKRRSKRVSRHPRFPPGLALPKRFSGETAEPGQAPSAG